MRPCSRITIEIHHQIFMHQLHAPSPPMVHARRSAEILNIARSAGPWWILTSETLRKLIFSAKSINFSISQKFVIFHENLEFHHHGPKLEPPITLHQKFSGSYPFQNLNPYDHSSGWTKGKTKRTTESRAHAEKPCLLYTSPSPRDS